ncbi:MAG: hypothetical protein NUV91_06685 [Candidatus Omnitrophica bacterium]|nr:hypothetical protein [Candidatus Omnitrophota bacterium]
MDNVLHLTTGQAFILVALYLWIFIIFPVIVIRKLNYMTSLLEAQFSDEDEEAENSESSS